MAKIQAITAKTAPVCETSREKIGLPMTLSAMIYFHDPYGFVRKRAVENCGVAEATVDPVSKERRPSRQIVVFVAWLDAAGDEDYGAKLEI